MPNSEFVQCGDPGTKETVEMWLALGLPLEWSNRTNSPESWWDSYDIAIRDWIRAPATTWKHIRIRIKPQ